MSLGGFLSEGGWYDDAEDVLANSYKFCNTREPEDCKIATKFLTRLLHVRTANCKFDAAKDTFQEAVDIASKLDSKNQEICLAVLYGEKCGLLFSLSDYGEGYVFSVKALRKIGPGLPMKVSIVIFFWFLETLASLDLARKSFGENNVQTAKHYGNLGRLFQSMRKYKEAEDMHKKAIEIKERILGSEDYEVALSLGHLASLYNYDMEQYDKAEQLYLRSIAIGKKLFGDGYSGLEYDYRGLINLYDSQGDFDRMETYHQTLMDWKDLRESANTKESAHEKTPDPWPTGQFIQNFLSQPD
ncbi:PREDICTED: amyloid protein-binding protein 2-like [Acropora digitifera]|uniref:amyloid protein-binding protein 2-like n=1 Tax=Acropora digitifera TaxID=70779 RepID=UPI00077A35D8|nr:PREDICTED: amyloid protein-binding protein 2-like [Acropora digitifera]